MTKKLQDTIFLLIPAFWLFVFFFVPFLIIFKLSLSHSSLSIPPYTPVIETGLFFEKIKEFHLNNYLRLLEDPLYFNSFISSFLIACAATFLTFVLGYPIAYAMVRASSSLQPVLLTLIILPFWTSFLIRVYAWTGILKPEGLMNAFLLWTGMIERPLIILNTNIAVIIGIVYSYLPFMILPLYVCLQKMDQTLLDAAQDLGCRPPASFWRITFPLSRSGIFAGCLLVFIPAMGEFVIPDLLGGSQTLMIGKILWNEFLVNRDWPAASAVATVFLVFLLLPTIIFRSVYHYNKEKGL